MEKTLSFFEQVLLEAPGDETPPDDASPEPAPDAGSPPDMPDIGGGDNPDGEESPPDMQDDTQPDDDFGSDFGSDDNDQQNNQDQNNIGIDEKISNILNKLLYDKFLTLLNQIGSQISNIKNNNEILHSLIPNLGEISEEFKRLDESIRLYINDFFIYENSSKNLLFFNQCLNALKLLNEKFSHEINKGIHN